MRFSYFLQVSSWNSANTEASELRNIDIIEFRSGADIGYVKSVN